MKNSIYGRGTSGRTINQIWSASRASLFLPVFLCFFLILGVERLHAAPEKDKPLKIAVLHCGDVVKSFELFTPLVRYLAEKTGLKLELVVWGDIPSLERSLRKGEIDFVLQDSPLYVRFSSYLNRELLLKVIGDDGKDVVSGIVFVRKDSPYQQISDLADKKVQFGPITSGVKWIAGRKLFADHGVLPEKDIKVYVGTGGCCEEIAFNVYFKKVDAGVICDHALEKLAKKGLIKVDELRTIDRTAVIPSAVFAAAKDVNPDIINAVFDATLVLHKDQHQYAKILADIDIDGFARSSDAAYENLRGWNVMDID